MAIAQMWSVESSFDVNSMKVETEMHLSNHGYWLIHSAKGFHRGMDKQYAACLELRLFLRKGTKSKYILT